MQLVTTLSENWATFCANVATIPSKYKPLHITVNPSSLPERVYTILSFYGSRSRYTFRHFMVLAASWLRTLPMHPRG